MATFEALPLEIRFMIIELALPDLVVLISDADSITSQRTDYSHRRNSSEKNYCRALLRIATTSRCLLKTICCLIESLKRQRDEFTYDPDGFHDYWCIEAGAWICQERKWCLLDVTMQSLLHVSTRRDTP